MVFYDLLGLNIYVIGLVEEEDFVVSFSSIVRLSVKFEVLRKDFKFIMFFVK